MKARTLDHPITAVEYHRLGAEGFFEPDERVELIEGDIIPMTPIGPEHNYSVVHFNRLFAPLAVQGRAVVNVQGSFALNNLSEPEPDVFLISPENFTSKALPRPHDILLVIEVANATLEFDRERKIPLYAWNGVREAWLLDLKAQTLTAYRVPSAKGYLEQKAFKRGESLAPEAFPDFLVAVDDLFE